MKKTLAVILAFAICYLMIPSVNAAEIPPISPYYTNATTVSATMDIQSDGIATIHLVCYGKSSVDSISATTYIEMKVGTSWVRVNIGTSTNTWSYTTSANRLVKTYSTELPCNGEYRVVTTFVLHSTTAETISRSETCSY